MRLEVNVKEDLFHKVEVIDKKEKLEDGKKNIEVVDHEDNVEGGANYIGMNDQEDLFSNDHTAIEKD